MAPTTRSSTKRSASDTANSNPSDNKGGGQAKKARSVPASVAAGKVTNTRCRLLELPAEIRNRIYNFAEKDYGVEDFAPLLRPLKPVAPRNAWFRSFIGLAQTCKQLRAEYRPLFLRALQVRIRLGQLDDFFATFYPNTPEDYQHAPTRFQISWNVGKDGKSGVMYDITRLLQLQAFSSTFNVDFVPHQVAQGLWPGNRISRAHVYDSDEDVFLNETEECTCDMYHDFDLRDWMITMDDEVHAHVHHLQEFILNNNEAWLKDLRQHKMSIQCFFNDDTYQWTIDISLNGPIEEVMLDGVVAPSHVWRYLKVRGMLQNSRLGEKLDMDFIVKYEEALTVRMGDSREVTTSVMKKVHIRSTKK
ncbi:uncharacterized protein K460DRAFT_360077 [Cucurbitaria berberidis CBS 394.84]|uniref:F-box domain-containing protein n=1 Tax=Cucurbitaria berberidis CBS 394.84 TaxID=1168544 RepID=A0A9P4G7C2_9PLEO|nr:uncharacterized protein K460DRAFT_360077 [Cucurbitaria berberidis CBS 394.84]KAF1840393.1 hypothetical protein K460DRAFT_360077 [Cucurbitaria berberidis CBS 394.84]